MSNGVWYDIIIFKMKVGDIMGIKKVMTGCPWHVEKMVRQEGDSRRHRSRCIYYNKKESHCSKVVGKCVGAAHCSYYDEYQAQEKVITEVNNIDVKVDFTGVKMIKVSDIELCKKYKEPDKEKVVKVVRYYKEHGELDKPISVSCYGDKYKLEDKYLRYFVAKQLGLDEVSARISTEKENKLEDKIRVVGTKVIHNKFGGGVIAAVKDNKIDIMFDSGKKIEFSIEICVKKEVISIV